MNNKKEKDLIAESLENDEVRRAVEYEWFADETILQIEQKMDDLSMSRADLAARLKCSPANVSQLLRRGSNLTLKTLMELALAMGHRFRSPTLESLSATAPWETCNVQLVKLEPYGSWKGASELASEMAEGSASVSVVWRYQAPEREAEAIPEVPAYTPRESGEINVH
jgi:transcriptional regulator with XRE-family HTH domain